MSPTAFGLGVAGLGIGSTAALAAVFAVAVAVSIAGLSCRRFFVRPEWLGAVSHESGLIAFLIFALMVTYLAAVRAGGRFGAGAGQLVARTRWRC